MALFDMWLGLCIASVAAADDPGEMGEMGEVAEGGYIMMGG